MATFTHQAQAIEFGASRSAESANDHELLAAIRDGDEAAFQEIVRRYRNPITNFIYRMIDDYERSVELAQETFIRVYTSASRYQANYSFSTYIYRIASNLAISELRKRKRRKFVSLFSPFTNDDGEAVELDPPDMNPLQDETMIEDERRRAVARAITSLPEKYRAAIVLRDVEGLSYDRIAEVLKLSEGTVKSRINRARNLLKEKLSAYI
ncbi:MAG TPA: sigma-70 family RNA polymerase sigma factor [Blastocatellia bacterium]|nr:sigma-70 family RNA polymerase sigma factor [Blastocatellia bacterium]